MADFKSLMFLLFALADTGGGVYFFIEKRRLVYYNSGKMKFLCKKLSGLRSKGATKQDVF